MKERLIAFMSIICISALMVSAQAAKGKPDKPSKTNTEWIAFTGDLSGGQAVEGCCPNAGPWPAYTMTLPYGLQNYPPGTYYGQLFINYYGAGRNQKYVVQFWNDETGIGIEIIGGAIDNDRKNKVLTVTFTEEECLDLWTGTPMGRVTFTLVRTPY